MHENCTHGAPLCGIWNEHLQLNAKSGADGQRGVDIVSSPCYSNDEYSTIVCQLTRRNKMHSVKINSYVSWNVTLLSSQNSSQLLHLFYIFHTDTCMYVCNILLFLL